jgi:hypothetical protein
MGERDKQIAAASQAGRCRSALGDATIRRSTYLSRSIAWKAAKPIFSPSFENGSYRPDLVLAEESSVSYRLSMSARSRFALPVIAAAALAMTACSRGDAQASAPPPPEVDAAQVVVKPVRQWDEFSGRIAATGAVEVRPRVSGYRGWSGRLSSAGRIGPGSSPWSTP